MYKLCFVFVVFLFACIVESRAQSAEKKLDSLFSVNALHKKEDSVRVKNLKEIYRQYMRMKNVPKAEEYAHIVISLANKLNLKKFEAEAYFRLGLFYHGSTNYEKAEENYLKSINSYTLLKDFDWVAGIYLNMGALYISIPDYSKALEVNQKAIAAFRRDGNEIDLASCYTNISAIYEQLGQQNDALFYLQKALKIFEKEGENSRGVAVVCNQIGSVYFTASDNELKKMGIKVDQRNEIALGYFNRALKVAVAIDDNGVQATINKNLGKVYEVKGDRLSALRAYQIAVDQNSKEDDRVDYAFSLLALANFYEQDRDFSKATTFSLDALKIGIDNKLLEIQRNAYLTLSAIEEKKANFNQSLAYYKKYIDLKEQIFNEEKEKEITRKQLQIKFAVKEDDYRLKQQITDGELQQQLLIAKQQQQQLVLRQQALDLSDKEKTLQRLTFLKRQADLENDKRLQQQLYDQAQLQAKFDKELKDSEINVQKTALKFNKNMNIFLGVLAIILLGSALIVFYAQRRTAKLNKVVSEQKVELEKLSRVKDRIFSVVGHDMRTPVNSLISFIQLLENGNIEQSKLNRYASQLKGSLSYASSMMENLLNWASSQMQGFKPMIEAFDMNVCVQEVIDMLSELATKKAISIENHIQGEQICLADRNMTALVLRNLINNAIKFTPENGLIIIATGTADNQLLVKVTDNGVGLSNSQLATFNEGNIDEHAQSTLGTNKEKGTGIGLMLCKTFTTLMNGTLQVQSKENVGTTFTLSLPSRT